MPSTLSPGLSTLAYTAMFACGAGVRLDVGVLGAEERLGAVAGEVLDLVDDLAAAVVALAGNALGVLVVEPRAERLEHRDRGEVLRGDELERLLLARPAPRRGGRRPRDRWRAAAGLSVNPAPRRDARTDVDMCAGHWRSLPLRGGCWKAPKKREQRGGADRAVAQHARGRRRAVDDSRGKSGRATAVEDGVDLGAERCRHLGRGVGGAARRGGWRWWWPAGRCAGAARARAGDRGRGRSAWCPSRGIAQRRLRSVLTIESAPGQYVAGERAGRRAQVDIVLDVGERRGEQRQLEAVRAALDRVDAARPPRCSPGRRPARRRCRSGSRPRPPRRIAARPRRRGSRQLARRRTRVRPVRSRHRATRSRPGTSRRTSAATASAWRGVDLEHHPRRR